MYRTPERSQSEKAGPSQDSRTPQQLTKAASPTNSSQARSIMSETVLISTPKTGAPKDSDRVTEARKWLQKAKQHISASRNLKAELKQGITQAVEHLYRLVKEAGANASKSPPTTDQPPLVPQASELGNAKLAEVFAKDFKKLEDLMGRQMDAIHKNLEKIEINNDKIDDLKSTIEEQREGGNETYASVTAAPPVRSTQPLQSMLVAAIDEDQGEEIFDQVRKAINAGDGKVGVERVRRAKDRRVIIACKTEEDRLKVKERIKETGTLKVRNIKNKDPLVILKNVLKDISDQDIISNLLNQNSNLRLYVDEDEKTETFIQVAYRKKLRNPHINHVVLRVAPVLYWSMIEAGTVRIDIQRIKVEDHSPLIQCSLCLGYGHGRRLCTDTVEKCSHCGGPHLKADCADWKAGTQATCCNCVRARLDNTAHNAFSLDCPVRDKWDALARSMVAYC